MIVFSKSEKVFILILILLIFIGSSLRLFKISKDNREFSDSFNSNLSEFQNQLNAIVEAQSSGAALFGDFNRIQPVDVNSASQNDFENLPHIGPVIARRIIAPIMLPVGALTAFLGGPLLLYLLIRRKVSI